MLKMTIHVRGLEQFPGRPEVQQAVGRALRRGVRSIVVRAQRNLAGRYLRVRTGKLRRGMRWSVKQKDGVFVATVRNVVFYGHILDGGAAAHVVPGVLGQTGQRQALARAGRVTPGERRAGEAAFLAGKRIRQKTLRFEVGGKVIFARSIVHPGLRPRRWFRDAVIEALPELQRAFEQELGVLSTLHGRIAS